MCDRLKAEREKKGLSQMELSLESDVSQGMITYIENKKRTPTLNTILKLCAALKIEPQVLFPKSEVDRIAAKRTVLDLIEHFM